MELSADQRQRLLKAKLNALVRDLASRNTADDQPADARHAIDPEVRGALTGLMAPRESGFVLGDFGTPLAVAASMSWALKAGSTSITLFFDFDAEPAARLASYFQQSGSSGRSESAGQPTERSQQSGAVGDAGFGAQVRCVVGASSVLVTPEPLPAIVEAPEAPEDLIRVLVENDLEVVTEHGVTRGEVLGLEVARLVLWPSETGGDDELHLEVGVGRFDRDAVWAVNDGRNMEQALGRTIELVRRSRYQGAPIHPLQRLNRERWLRSMIVRNPELVGATELTPVGMTIEATGMKDVHPAGAFGRDEAGEPIVVVTSTGVDLAAVPLAADLRAALGADSRLVIAVPFADMHPIRTTLAAMLQPAAEVVPVPVEWG